ncbi:hypothetical protein DAEQUDRAFT_92072 [Daedalea quercina L-15889]|uniref:Uncharacterized protein n=1 Tax=Daedalea quercina L-15889 TaxID=1314783 RepID=A0A165S8R0_9APHY|nr:hypothetical protein DAEQUDRAFT_92072 [Daedalea quercina L-15889]
MLWRLDRLTSDHRRFLSIMTPAASAVADDCGHSKIAAEGAAQQFRAPDRSLIIPGHADADLRYEGQDKGTKAACQKRHQILSEELRMNW